MRRLGDRDGGRPSRTSTPVDRDGFDDDAICGRRVRGRRRTHEQSHQRNASSLHAASSGAVAIKKLLEQYPDMDAVFVANDQMALSVMQAACQTGLSIPDSLGVVGKCLA